MAFGPFHGRPAFQDRIRPSVPTSANDCVWKRISCWNVPGSKKKTATWTPLLPCANPPLRERAPPWTRRTTIRRRWSSPG